MPPPPWRGFEHYLPLSDERRKEVWERGLTVLDTNVLLDLYRLPERERDEVMMVLSHTAVADRLWIPHQVMEEFLRGRLTVINDQVVSANNLRDKADQAMAEFGKAADAARKHHPFFDASAWRTKLEDTLRELRAHYDQDRDNYPITVREDPFLPRVLDLLDGRVGPPLSDAASKEAEKEADRRVKEKIPPGYEDRKKDGRRAYGDYFVWRQLLSKATEAKSDVVFVTNEAKDDWLHRVGGQTLGPRPELRREFQGEVGDGHEVIFQSLGRFVETACERYSLGIAYQTVLDEALQEAEGQGAASMAMGFRMPNTFIIPRETVASTNGPVRDGPATSEQMVEWFLGNYKDPADGVPYDSGEGGYQYWNGGPYDAREEIDAHFPGAAPEEIAKAVSVLERMCWEWVRQDEY